ncbi:MAG: sugar transferase [Chitinivibrionales bacterium]|nr:sugar transferase [Chitinivibrionales bacterium]MBD3356281.1 sugar transferase [Chitinivibrionales bacterium]
MRNTKSGNLASQLSTLTASDKKRSKSSESTKTVDKYGLYDENTFKSLLSAERKRTERTSRSFVLSLVDVRGLWDEFGKDGIGRSAEMMDTLVEALHRRSRDIDIKGWYRQDKLIGIIYPETDKGIQPVLEGKLKDALVETIGDHFHSHVGVTWYGFPNEPGSWDGHASKEAPAFYPEAAGGAGTSLRAVLTRVLDIVGSLTGIIAFFPLFVVIPLLIKLTSKGPVFFRQQRVGAGGKRFTLMKFRSMRISAKENMHKEFVKNFIRGESSEEAQEKKGVYKITDDPRVTLIGKLLRKTSLDELPQFFNVLRGDMSLVGPRPAIPYEVDEYRLWHRRRLFEGKPGITGRWQVEGRSSASFDEMVRMDLQYLERGNLWSYIKFIIKTPLALLTMRGAY